MRRGHLLEAEINKLVEYINASGGHAHKNHAERLSDGTYIRGEPFDYEIFLRDYKAVFDAKECHELKWRLKEKDIVQMENLKHCKNSGLDAFFLIYFYPIKKLKKIDVDKVIEVLSSGKKSISHELGEDWEGIK